MTIPHTAISLFVIPWPNIAMLPRKKSSNLYLAATMTAYTQSPRTVWALLGQCTGPSRPRSRQTTQKSVLFAHDTDFMKSPNSSFPNAANNSGSKNSDCQFLRCNLPCYPHSNVSQLQPGCLQEAHLVCSVYGTPQVSNSSFNSQK